MLITNNAFHSFIIVKYRTNFSRRWFTSFGKTDLKEIFWYTLYLPKDFSVWCFCAGYNCILVPRFVITVKIMWNSASADQLIIFPVKCRIMSVYLRSFCFRWSDNSMDHGRRQSAFSFFAVVWTACLLCQSIAWKMLSQAQLLDELMGRDRNLAPQDKKCSVHWSDPPVSPFFYAKFCELASQQNGVVRLEIRNLISLFFGRFARCILPGFVHTIFLQIQDLI